jgi:hypothetical protein
MKIFGFIAAFVFAFALIGCTGGGARDDEPEEDSTAARSLREGINPDDMAPPTEDAPPEETE